MVQMLSGGAGTVGNGQLAPATNGQISAPTHRARFI